MHKQFSPQLESLSCLLYTLAISHLLICSSKYYREMRAVEVWIVCTPVKKANSDSLVFYTVFLSLYGLCKTYKLKTCEISNSFGEKLLNLIFIYQWNSNYISLLTNILLLYKTRCDHTNRRAVHVIPWRCLSNTLPLQQC